MILNIVLLILALGVDALIYILTGLYNFVEFIWVPIIALPIIFILLWGVELLILLIWSLFFDKSKIIKKPNKFYLWLVYQVNFQVVLFSGTRIKLINKRLLPKHTRYLLIYNHLSNFDPMVIMKLFYKDDIVCVSKKSNLNIPIAGPFIHKAGFIAFDRDDVKQSADAGMRAMSFLQNNYCSIAIAPEGTRNKDVDEKLLLPFHEGAISIAYHTKTPIVVTVLTNTHKIRKNFPFKLTRVKYKIIGTLYYEDYKKKTISELTEFLYNQMYQELTKLMK